MKKHKTLVKCRICGLLNETAYCPNWHKELEPETGCCCELSKPEGGL